MLVSEFLEKTNYALRGTDEDAPDFSSEEGSYWVDILVRKVDELYQDPKNWGAIYNGTIPVESGTVATTGTTALVGTDTYFTDYAVGDKITVDGETVRTIATITSDTALTVTVAFSNTASGKTFTRKPIIATGVSSYNLNRAFISTSDKPYVIKTDGNKSYQKLIKAEERDLFNRQVFIAGLNPRTLYFTSDIEATDEIVGGELVIPGYYMPAEITAETDVIQVPNPNWCVAAVAAEIAFGDITYEDRAEALNNKANYLYGLMTKLNRKGSYGNPRITPTSVKKINGVRKV